MDQLESLSSQLDDNRLQLQQLDQLLADDPDNAELRGIRDDLAQVIQVTIDLQKAAAEEAGGAGAEAGSAVAAPAPAAPAAAPAFAVAPSITPAAAATPYAPVSAFAAASAASAPAAASSSNLQPYVSAPGPDGLFAAGSRVMAVYAKDGKSYVSRIDGVDEGSETYRVTYLEYGQQASVAFEQVSPWRSASAEQLRLPNVPVKAVYPEDGLFYAASLDGPAPGMPGFYIVKFGANAAGGAAAKKKKKVEVALHDLVINDRFMDPRSMTLTSAASSSAKAAAAPLSEEFPVPEHLQPRDGDSDAVRTQKAKKLKKLRFEHKKAFDEQQSNVRKNSWLDFKAGKTAAAGGGAAKKAKLSHAPGLAALKKPSMFATPDSLAGVVGVVGSGRGMTEAASFRSKHVFDEAKDQAAAAAQQYRPPVL